MGDIAFFEEGTNDCFDSYYCKNHWKFEVGQVFEGFWGCTSTVTRVELGMVHESGGLMVVQRVWVKRVPIKF